MDHPKPWLRYVDTKKVADDTLSIDGMKVRNAGGDKLGEVDGYIVDANSGRPFYIVVDAGGWFKAKHFLMPIGQTHLDGDRDALVVNLSKEQVGHFPGFDKDTFETLTDADINRINDDICQICEADEAVRGEGFVAWDRRSYQVPDWWSAEKSQGGSATEPDRTDAALPRSR